MSKQKKSVKVDINDINDVAFMEANPNSHSEDNLNLIESSIRNNGTGRSILVDETNTLIAGEGTTTAAKSHGIQKVIVVEAEGDALVAVRRVNLSPEQKRNLAILDNRASELSDWDEETLANALKQIQEEGESLDIVGFDNDMLTHLLANLEPPDLDALAAEHGVAEDGTNHFELAFNVMLQTDVHAQFTDWWKQIEGDTPTDKAKAILAHYNSQ